MTKTTLQNEIVWSLSTPWESEVYTKHKQFIPTNVAFHPTNKNVYITDGYDTDYIHRYDQNNKYLNSFERKDRRDQHRKFATPHGIWLDDRPGREPQLTICDRANARLEYFTLDNKYASTMEKLSYPTHLDTRSDVLMCPDLHARISLFSKDNQLITHLGFDQAWTDRVLNKKKQNNLIMRTKPET